MEPAYEQAATTWLTKNRATQDPETLSKVVARAREIHGSQGGYISPSHFERAYLELVNEKEITPFRGNMAQRIAEESSPIPKEVVDFIERRSAFEIKNRYRTDAEFRRHYDAYQRRPKQSQEITLTADEYRRMSSQEVRERMRNPRWKLALMLLIKNGEV